LTNFIDNNEPDYNKLAQSFQQGDEKAFEAIYQRYYQVVIRFCKKRVQDEHIAEQLAQETFIKVLCNIKKFKGFDKKNGFLAWLFRIAVNTVISYCRHENERKRVEQTALEKKEIQQPRYDKPERTLLKEELEQIAFQGIPSQIKESIIAHYFYGATYKEMMRMFNLSFFRVNHYMYEGRCLIRANLRGYYP
jgi:RNA polymerase sigma-70 factor (ECF subfamily)